MAVGVVKSKTIFLKDLVLQTELLKNNQRSKMGMQRSMIT
jgi:hypothetical protein